MDEQKERLPPKPKFDELTEKRIRNLFAEKRNQKDQKRGEDDLEFEANIFIEILLDWGASIPEFAMFKPPRQQKRREAIKSMGSALIRCIKQFEALDSGARGFVIFSGIEEMAKTVGEPNPLPEDIRTNFLVEAHKDDVLKELKAFASGVLKAADNLPEPPEPPIELRMALWIEDIFWHYGFEFTTSQTGFAAECLRAILGLGGINKDRVDYWLIEARNHSDSMTTLINKYRKTTEKIH